MEKAVLGSVALEGEACAKNARVEGDVVWIDHKTKLKNGQCIYITTGIDLSEETSEDVMINAGYNYLIQCVRPRVLKGLGTDEALAKHEVRIKPSDYPPEKRSKKDPVTDAKDKLMKLSRVEFREYMAEIMDMTPDQADELYDKKHGLSE